jgi:hypothetical protein
MIKVIYENELDTLKDGEYGIGFSTDAFDEGSIGIYKRNGELIERCYPESVYSADSSFSEAKLPRVSSNKILIINKKYLDLLQDIKEEIQ